MTPDQHVEFEFQSSSLGARLRGMREASGRTVVQVAATLRIPIALVEAIEHDDFGRLGAPVYVRGHLTAYARLLGVPMTEVDHALDDRTPVPPELVALAPSTRLQRFADRAARRAVYVVLTSAIVLPVVWYAMQPALHNAPMALDSLDLPGSVAELAPAPAAKPEEQAPTRPAKEYPIVASLAPFYAKQPAADDAATEASPTQDAWLSLHLIEASWIEVYDADGRSIEQALLPAGSERHYGAGQVGRVTLGNAEAVVVSKSGKTVDVSAYRRANVARFAISSDGSLLPAGG